MLSVQLLNPPPHTHTQEAAPGSERHKHVRLRRGNLQKAAAFSGGASEDKDAAEPLHMLH